MIRRISLLITAALMAALMMVATAVPAFAASPSQRACEAGGGTFTRDGGQVQCVTTTDGKNPKFTDTTTTTGQGNSSNRPASSDECAGTGSGKCPPGQF